MRKVFAVTVASLALAGVAFADSNTDINSDQSNQQIQQNPDMNQQNNQQGSFGNQVPGGSVSGTEENANAPSMTTPQMAIDRFHAINQEEIKAGKMAKSNGSKLLHSYADRLVKDHEQFDKDLKTLAKKENVKISDPDKVAWPTDVQQKMQQDQAMLDQLKNMKGTDFDKQFLTMMSQGHQDALDFINQVSSNTQDTALKDYFMKVQPKLEEHKKMADELQKRVGQAVQGRR